MKKIYLIPTTKIVNSQVPSSFLAGSPSKGTEDGDTKNFAGAEKVAGSDDDFWSTEK